MMLIATVVLLAVLLALVLKVTGLGLVPASTIYFLIIIAGGITAKMKGDFASRGYAISFLTGPFGLLVLLLAPAKRKPGRADDWREFPTEERGGEETQEPRDWPENGWIALVGVVSFILASIIF